MLQLIQKAHDYPSRKAIIDPKGSYSYRVLLERSEQVALTLLGKGKDTMNLSEARIGFMVQPGM